MTEIVFALLDKNGMNCEEIELLRATIRRFVFSRLVPLAEQIEAADDVDGYLIEMVSSGSYAGDILNANV